MSEGLQVRGLCAEYSSARKVLHEINLDAHRGEVTALLGPNGSGKSTLLKAILGLVRNTGELLLDGEDLRDIPLLVRARKIAYVPQRTKLTSNISVEKVVELGRFVHVGPLGQRSEADQAAVQGALEECEASHLAARPFTQLSGGEQQRVLIARALATGAGALLLDEPTSSQDIRHTLDIHAVLRKLAERGCAVVVVLHDLGEARNHAGRAVLLKTGRVHSAGPILEVISPGPIGAVYDVELIEGAALGYRRTARHLGVEQ